MRQSTDAAGGSRRSRLAQLGASRQRRHRAQLSNKRRQPRGGRTIGSTGGTGIRRLFRQSRSPKITISRSLPSPREARARPSHGIRTRGRGAELSEPPTGISSPPHQRRIHKDQTNLDHRMSGRSSRDRVSVLRDWRATAISALAITSRLYRPSGSWTCRSAERALAARAQPRRRGAVRRDRQIENSSRHMDGQSAYQARSTPTTRSAWRFSDRPSSSRFHAGRLMPGIWAVLQEFADVCRCGVSLAVARMITRWSGLSARQGHAAHGEGASWTLNRITTGRAHRRSRPTKPA